jgi:hypothetical protein
MSKERRLGRDRPPCGDRRSAKRPRRFLEKASNSFAGHPFFSRSVRRQKQIRMAQLIQAAPHGPSMTIEELSDVGILENPALLSLVLPDFEPGPTPPSKAWLPFVPAHLSQKGFDKSLYRCLYLTRP